MSDEAPVAHDAPVAPEAAAVPKMELAQLKAVIESLMFASPEPLTPRMLYRLLNDEPKEDVRAALDALKADYADRGGLHVAEVAGGYQITTRPEYHACAFDLIGAVYMGDVEPGEMIIAGPRGIQRERYAPARKRAQCAFEHVYFSRPDSLVFGRSVQQSRELMGRLLAREYPVDADVVVPVPDSGVAAALGYSSESQIPFRHGLIRNHYVGRTFIEPSQAIRDFGVKLKLNPVRHLLEGKRVILVDDSIVRGTTSRKLVRMVRGAGATEVHLRISCPPTVSPCFYGVDTPTKNELIAANNSVEEIRNFVEADTLGYLSHDNLKTAVGDDRDQFCYACYTGDYPTELIHIDELAAAKPVR